MATTTVDGRDIGDQRERVDRAETLLIGALTLLGLGICLYRIGQSSLWLDEAFSVAGSGDLARSWTDRGGSMGLYYSFLSVWTDADGSTAWIRLPSAVFAAATVPFTYLIARAVGGRRVAVIAASLLIANWGFVRYGQEARSYSMVMLLVAVSWWLFVEIVRGRRGSAWWVAYAAATGLVGYAQPLGLLAVAPQAIVLLLVPGLLVAARRMLPGFVVAALLTVPLLVLVLRAGDAQPSWVRPLNLRQFEQLQTQLGGSVQIGAWVVTIALLAGIVVSVVAAVRGAPTDRWVAALPAIWFTIPIAGLVVLSLIEPYFVARYLLPVAPAAAILLAVALDALPRSIDRVAHIGLLALLFISVLRLWDHPRQGWAAVVDHIAINDPDGTLFFADPELRIPFEHALITAEADHDLVPLAPPREWGGLPRYLPQFSLDDAGPTLDRADTLWIVDWGRPDGSGLTGRVTGVLEHPVLDNWCPTSNAQFPGDLFVVNLERCN